MNRQPLAPRAHTTRADTAAQATAHGAALRRLALQCRALEPAEVAEFVAFCLAAFAVGLIVGFALFGT